VKETTPVLKLLPDGRRQITGFLYPGDFLGMAYGWYRSDIAFSGRYRRDDWIGW
jgi:CRP/FNR family transcriptional regulator